ncbi:MAG: hypothetical protein EON95_15535 [Caulobacteraceae bacterium]|nr:MAG: hypothetical protein EON95_15535 [Caulobacteraceae bacterium]
MLFKRRTNKDDFEREVLREISYMRDMHGDDAPAVAKQRAARPRLGGARRRVIEEAARRLAADQKPSAPGSRTP